MTRESEKLCLEKVKVKMTREVKSENDQIKVKMNNLPLERKEVKMTKK